MDSREVGRPTGGVAEERRWASIVFADLSGFTALAERLDPEDAKELAQACVAQFSATVARFGGTVLRELGDEVGRPFEEARQARPGPGLDRRRHRQHADPAAVSEARRPVGRRQGPGGVVMRTMSLV